MASSSSAVAVVEAASTAPPTGGRIRRKGKKSVAAEAACGAVLLSPPPSSAAFRSSSSGPSSADPLLSVWLELEAQIEQTLAVGEHQQLQAEREEHTATDSGGLATSHSPSTLHSHLPAAHRSGVQWPCHSRSPPPSPPLSSTPARPLPHSQSTPFLRPALAPLPCSSLHCSSPPWSLSSPLRSPEWSQASPSSAFSPSPSLTTCSSSSTYSPSCSPLTCPSFSSSSSCSSSSFPPSSSSSSSTSSRVATSGFSSSCSSLCDSRALLDQSRLQALAQSRRSAAAVDERSSEAAISLDSRQAVSTALGISLLSSLPGDVLHRLLCYLDVPTLCRVSAVCRLLKAESEVDDLWADLVADRWPVQRDREDVRVRWKATYRAREDQDRAAFFASLPADQLPLTHWQALYAAQLSRQRSSRRRVNEFEVIRAWREAHSASLPSAGHACSFLHCAFVQLLPELFICTDSHAVHFCLAACLAVEGRGEGRCAVSGRWPSSQDRSLHHIGEQEEEDEEAGEAGGAGGGQADGGGACDGDGGGALSAYLLACFEDDGLALEEDDTAPDGEEGERGWLYEEAEQPHPLSQQQPRQRQRLSLPNHPGTESRAGKRRRRMPQP